MRKKANIATIADIIVIIAVTLLNPMLFPQMPPPSIPDKVVKHYKVQLTADSIQNAMAQTEKEIDEMSYYLRLHNVPTRYQPQKVLPAVFPSEPHCSAKN